MKTFILSSVAMLGFAATPLWAQSEPNNPAVPKDQPSSIDMKQQAQPATREAVSYGGVVDMNGNQTFSLEEIARAYPNVTVKAFQAMDVDESGELNTAELASAKQQGILPH